MGFIRRSGETIRVGAVLILGIAVLSPLVGMVLVFRASERLPGVPDRGERALGKGDPQKP